MKISKQKLRKLIRETLESNRSLARRDSKKIDEISPSTSMDLQKGDKVVVSKDGLFRFAKTAPHTMRDLENKLHDALNNGTVGIVIMVSPGQGARVDFDGIALDVFEWMLEKV